MAQDEKPTIETPAPATPVAEPTTQTVNGNMPAHLAGVKMEDTFLPEAAPEGSEEVTTIIDEDPETPAETTTPVDAPVAPVTQPETPPATPPVEQPATAANAEIVDTTTPAEPKLLAGKYKTVDELRHGIEELGGDPTGITDTVALEQSYLAVQKVYNRMTERNKKAEDIVTPEDEPAKPFELSDDIVQEMTNQLDFTDENLDMRGMAAQMFRIMFGTLGKNLPQMLPKQETTQQLTPQQMAAEVRRVETVNDSLGFIEAKVPRLVTDPNFRVQFANHLAAGKKAGTYPEILTRDNMTTAMKDFLAGAASMAEEAKRLEVTATEDKGAAAAPDGGGAPASTEPAADPEGDILGSIMESKVSQDQRINFTK